MNPKQLRHTKLLVSLKVLQVRRAFLQGGLLEILHYAATLSSVPIQSATHPSSSTSGTILHAGDAVAQHSRVVFGCEKFFPRPACLPLVHLEKLGAFDEQASRELVLSLDKLVRKLDHREIWS